MSRRRTLRERVEARMARKGDDVFLPRAFADLGGEDQVLRVLRAFPLERLAGCGKTIFGRFSDAHV